MAMNEDRFDDERMKGLDELDDYTVADGEPDPRGWEVRSGATKIGEVDDLIVDTASMTVRYLDVDLDDEVLGGLEDSGHDHVSIPVERVQLDHERKQVILGGTFRSNDLVADDEFRFHGSPSHRARTGSVPADRQREYDVRGRGEDEHQTLTRSEEEVGVRKDRVQTGEVIAGKHVETEQFRQPESRPREEFEEEFDNIEQRGRNNRERE